MLSLEMYAKGSYSQISAVKSIFWQNFISVNMFYYAKGMGLNKITEIKKLSKLIKFILQEGSSGLRKSLKNLINYNFKKY